MDRTDTTEGQALWQPGGDEEDSRLREGDRHLRLAYEEEDKQDWPGVSILRLGEMARFIWNFKINVEASMIV